ncbi:MAG: hypothetical protein AABM30_11995 [Actinomycetota bacterium]
MNHRLFSAGVAAVALAYLIDVFLPWIPLKYEGTSLGTWAGTRAWPVPISVVTASMLLLWDVRIALSARIKRWRHVGAAVIAGITGGIALAGVLDARTTALLHPDHSLAYGAWIAIPVGVLLLLGALGHLVAFMRLAPAEVPQAPGE